MTTEFGTRLRQLRLRAGLTQEDLAARANVSVRSIGGYETGRRTDPRMATVRQLADALALEPELRQELLNAAAGTPDEPVDRQTDPAVAELAHAVRVRWQDEENLRQIRDPFPLPVRWEAGPADAMDHEANICRVPPGGQAQPLDLTGQLAKVVDFYQRIPSGRLVVLGKAGSGKTIFTLRFVLDLLGTRPDTVPVIFSIATWNPTTTSFRDWLTDRLTREYAQTTAATFVETGRILPVLDGFDEIATGLRRAALRELNHTTMPLVLTSRPDEYQESVRETDVLTAAAVVELADLTLADLADYLPRTTNRTSSAKPLWSPILAELRDRPQSDASVNLTKVLTTPLMVALARAIYSDTHDHDPAELLDTKKLSTPEALERHLLASFVPTAYQDQPGTRRWELDRVQRWLGYLATQDIAWWRLGTTMRRSTQALLVAVVVGLVNGVVNGLGAGFTEGLAAGLKSALIGGLAMGVAFGLAHAVGLSSGVLEPSRVRIQVFGRAGPTRAKFLRRLTLGLAGGLAGGIVLGLAGGLGEELIGGLGTGLVGGIGVGLGFGLLCGLVGGLITRFEVPIDVRSTASPVDMLRVNRITVAVQSLLWGPVFGLGVGIIGGVVDGLAFGLVIGLGVGVGYGLSLTAWGQWVVLARLWLPLRGRLPWAVIAFLDDACQRGVLRQAGAVYQFRHARLRDQLIPTRD